MQKLLTKAIRAKLIANHLKAERVRLSLDDEDNEQDIDFAPPLKLFCPWGAATWLITELDPETNIAFGLADLGLGFAELGSISIDEIAIIRHVSGLRIERDIHFDADGRTLSEYARDANKRGYIAA